jgi:ADP-L-glycero-D-manno-heptose 6-epimerase
MIVITGAKGFIGKNFIKVVNDQIIEVETDNCFDFIDNFTDWGKVNLIIHQGAISSTIERDINKLHKFNVDFTLKLLEKAIEYQIDTKYASSASIYGNTSNHLYNPLNYYAITKLQIDLWVKDNINKFSNIQGFRYYNVYGHGEEKKHDQASPISKFKKQIIENGSLKLFEGSENYYRDFINVDDVVSIMLNNNKSSGIYDLGTSKPISFRQVAEEVANKFNGSIIEIPFPSHLKGKYQSYTCAKNEWKDFNFKTVKGFLNES